MGGSEVMSLPSVSLSGFQRQNPLVRSPLGPCGSLVVRSPARTILAKSGAPQGLSQLPCYTFSPSYRQPDQPFHSIRTPGRPLCVTGGSPGCSQERPGPVSGLLQCEGPQGTPRVRVVGFPVLLLAQEHPISHQSEEQR